MPQGGFAFNKTVFAIVGGASGPVLLRGGRIDGPGRLTFSGSPADFLEKGETVTSPGAAAWTFYEKVLDPGPEDALYVYPSTPGCYAIQVDGPTFEDTIVIIATRGPSQG